MTFCVLCAVFVLSLNVQAWKIEYVEPGKDEGEECHKEATEVWTCKKDYDCEALKEILLANRTLPTCSWIGTTHILCCPPEKQPERLQVSKSEELCAKYQNQLCGLENPFHSSFQEPLLTGREKRQLYKQPNFTTAGGKKFFLRSHVFGGKKAKPAENPHMAMIGYGDPGDITWQCGGTLISENFVLSAAHCVSTPYGLPRWVRLGELDIKSDTEDARPQEMEIVDNVVHPGYRPPAFYNDLALLRLSRSVVFDKYVKPACLHTGLGDPPGVGTAAGWGKNETSGPKSSVLMKVDISFVPADDCKQIVGVIDRYLPNGVNTDTMVCAGELGKDTCQGDSGGPLILPLLPNSRTDCLAKLVGVTSFGPRNCGMTLIPGAYVRVAYFLSWIESIVWPD